MIGDQKVHKGVRAMVVPGSQSVKRQAEDEGLDEIFKSAGFEWRESGCSMCSKHESRRSTSRRTLCIYI